ncbi:MAG: 16S rRNA (cytidine(1402)-2'-O)-methyltransferase [Bdellovibrionales bacterium RIFOXYC1_FULL_54_43]|nr:MAG: 16S rRNA (cytidine(1402)-2'-O)-methyltransferase [Bdellovibrionales bacterium RIFOXYC1_FULL_54_43]OFZ82397.1 MAG: 16S rRNA (cytidine(1402)-2'-O)-methyltransferase [Bdellovibrionales bacterium RIFOXYD1_FULL_55_31]
MDEIKRQILPAGLWVIATPIGNLQDISLRAKNALEDADGILCEDTRRTAALISALGVRSRISKLVRLDAHAKPAGIEAALARLKNGESLALVTDAGTPAISDPGSALVEAAHRAGIQVTPIPGPSAVMALLSIAGFEETSFTFRGFFPRREVERRNELAACAGSGLSRVFVWFESPERISEALAVVARERPRFVVIVAKELTKLHEKIFRGGAVEVAAAIAAEIDQQGARGEWCFGVHTARNAKESCELGQVGQTDESSEWVKALRCLADARVSASDAVRQVSHHFGVPKNTVYERALKIFSKK